MLTLFLASSPKISALRLVTSTETLLESCVILIIKVVYKAIYVYKYEMI